MFIINLCTKSRIRIKKVRCSPNNDRYQVYVISIKVLTTFFCTVFLHHFFHSDKGFLQTLICIHNENHWWFSRFCLEIRKKSIFKYLARSERKSILHTIPGQRYLLLFFQFQTIFDSIYLTQNRIKFPFSTINSVEIEFRF